MTATIGGSCWPVNVPADAKPAVHRNAPKVQVTPAKQIDFNQKQSSPASCQIHAEAELNTRCRRCTADVGGSLVDSMLREAQPAVTLLAECAFAGMVLAEISAIRAQLDRD